MPHSTFEKFLPAAGTLAGILFAISGYVAHTPENASANPVTAMEGHETQNFVALVAGALFAVTIAFFTVAIRQALRSGEPRESTYSSAAFAGGVMVAMTSALNAWIMISLIDAADSNDVPTARVLSTLGIDSWLPFMAAAAVLLLSTGLGGLRTAVLPKWLSIVTIVLGVACVLGPTGVGAYFVTPIWMVIVGVLMLRGTGSQTVTTSATPQTTAYANS